jgi:hypothetical protein
VIRWRKGTVVKIRREWPGAVELDVEIENDGAARALAYPALVGSPQPGDAVLLNTTALAMGLGTGGYAMVVAVPDRLPPDPSGPGHLVKARYTPLQATVLGADEQDSEHHEVLREADSVGGMPVIVADLHSALPAITAGLHLDRPGTRVVYVMPDGGALPSWFSRSQGPGNLGTGTRWGFSGVSAGEAVNAAGVLQGRPVASLRVSEADARERHLGVSHHSLTAYGRVALARAQVVVPELPGAFGARVRADAEPLGSRHELVRVPLTGLEEALRKSPVRLSTMGRGLDEDLAGFLTVAAAGRHAAALLG